MKMDEIPNQATVREVAKVLACSRETVRRMVRSGEIPSIKVGREIRLDPRAVMAALQRKGG